MDRWMNTLSCSSPVLNRSNTSVEFQGPSSSATGFGIHYVPAGALTWGSLLCPLPLTGSQTLCSPHSCPDFKQMPFTHSFNSCLLSTWDKPLLVPATVLPWRPVCLCLFSRWGQVDPDLWLSPWARITHILIPHHWKSSPVRRCYICVDVAGNGPLKNQHFLTLQTLGMTIFLFFFLRNFPVFLNRLWYIGYTSNLYNSGGH